MVLLIRTVLVSVISRADIRIVEVALTLLKRAILFAAVHHVVIFNYVFI